MKPKTKLRHKINSVANGRWAAYTAAAAASTFAAASSAEATIHYSGVINRELEGRNSARFPIVGGHLTAVHNFYVYGSSSFKDGGQAFFFIDAHSGAVNGEYATCATNIEIASVSNLNLRDAISARPFVPKGGLLATSYGADCGFKDRGQFKEPGIAFVGFKFNNGAGDQYGWARLQMRGAPFNQFRMVDYAYGDPGEKVLAGQRSNGSAPVLESLGGLALGGTGLVAWRRRRSVRDGSSKSSL